jgi:hypothetical protein
MDEARAVLHRLRRIEALDRERAPAESLLAEVRALLVEAEAWVASDRPETDDAELALGQCREALANGGRVAAEAVAR